MGQVTDVLLHYRIHEKAISHVKRKEQHEITCQIQNRMLSFLTSDDMVRKKIATELWGKKRKFSKLSLFGVLPLLSVKKRKDKKRLRNLVYFLYLK